jgi:kumamolisin
VTEKASLPGSARTELTGAEVVGPVRAEDRIVVTLILRRRAEIPIDLVEGPDTVTRNQLAQRHGAHPDDVARVRQELAASGLEVRATDLGMRSITITGPASAMTAVFGAELTVVRSTDPVTGRTVEHRARSGELRVPAALSDVVIAVLGLDDRPQARAHSRVLRAADQPAETIYYLPTELGAIYDFPPDFDGSNQTLAIIELGGGFDPRDLETYFAEIGVPAPSVRVVSVDGAQNSPTGDPSSADGEVELDIEIAGALAPGAELLVYFAPNTDQGFLDALNTAIHAQHTPTAISISWGSSEDKWTPQARTVFDHALADAAALGVTVCVAAGDNGSSDGQANGRVHVDFPASSPHALACGGTRLETDSTGAILSETVWNDGTNGGATGGGVSDVFALPAYQATAGVPGRVGGGTGRGVPDIAAEADPVTGYVVLVDGEWVAVGGTSAVAPLWAALLCRLAQAIGRPLGLVQTRLYAGAKRGQGQPGFRDITVGNNGAYRAGPGWDACTGLGVPDGTALLKRLGG